MARRYGHDDAVPPYLADGRHHHAHLPIIDGSLPSSRPSRGKLGRFSKLQRKRLLLSNAGFVIERATIRHFVVIRWTP
jgi:hypothetical protein